MMTATTTFIRGETDVASKKKVHTPWKSQDQSKRHTSERRPDFRNQPKDGRGSNKFTPLTRMPKEIFEAESGKLKPPPPMVTPLEKRSSNKFCEFHNDKGYNTNECVQLRKQIEELVRAGKLSHFIKEIRQDRDQQKTGKKDAPVKDKAADIYMIQPWQRMMRQKVTQSFARVKEITFPPLTANKGTEGPLIIEAEIGGHAVHSIYVDEGSSMEIKNQMVSATTSLTGFSGETIWPLRQLRLLVTIGDAEHSTKAWMNFMIVRSLSPYNGITVRPGIREIQEVLSTAHRMLKFSVNGRIVTIHSTILTPTECATIAATPKDSAKNAEARYKFFKVVIHPDFSNQEITIGGTHRLNIREGYPHVRQKKRGQSPERAKAIQVEVQKLVEAGILREVYYHDWLSNPVMVKKHDARPTKAITKYRWGNKMRKRRLSTPVTGDFHWTLEAEQAFKQLKQHLAKLPMLVAPKPKEELMMYLSASYKAISAVLMIERDTVLTQTSVKGQILADFLVEKPDDAPPEASVIETPQEP
ncbi:reverse transcriptase domain-containing protein [Tanacetum coccineum]